MSQSRLDALRQTIAVANSIHDTLCPHAASGTPCTCHTPIPVPASHNFNTVFVSPEPIAQKLIAIGLPNDVAERLSNNYMQKAYMLKDTSETSARKTCAQLVGVTQDGESNLEALQNRVCEVYHHRYKTTLAEWAEEATDIARTHLQSLQS